MVFAQSVFFVSFLLLRLEAMLQPLLESLPSNPSFSSYPKSYKTMGKHCKAMLDLQKKGSIVFDYGNNIRGQAKESC